MEKKTMAKINPFKPNSPVPPGMFIGRIPAIESLEQCLIQTKAGQPVNFMITGERGIGKSSLLLYFADLACGAIPYVDESKFNFIVISTDIEHETTQIGLMKKIKIGLERKLAPTELGRDFLSKTWSFLQRLEIAGSKINSPCEDVEIALESFAYSLADTIKRITEESDNKYFSGLFDGVLIQIDETSNASPELNLGSFFKILCERLQRNGCNKVMFGIAGLPDLRNILMQSHPSSLRIFEEVILDRLEDIEVHKIIDKCLEQAKKDNSQETTIESEARATMTMYSEGYPHFVQQIGFSAFAIDNDDNIDKEDVTNGFWAPQGALEQIGNRYYRDNFYGKIQKDNYRQVLRIMAKRLDDWVEKADIKKKFKGNETTLDNAIQALRKRKIIISKEGVRGVYRLQHKGFAAWIRHYADSCEN